LCVSTCCNMYEAHRHISLCGLQGDEAALGGSYTGRVTELEESGFLFFLWFLLLNWFLLRVRLYFLNVVRFLI
jgi:hypothetical protein